VIFAVPKWICTKMGYRDTKCDS